MAPSPSRVASRYLISRVWSDPGAVWTAYNKALIELDLNVSQESKQPRPNPYVLRRYFIPVVEKGREMATWALQTRSIPSGQAKAMELAARLVALVRVPSNIISWYDTNRTKLNFLLETLTWPEKSDGSKGKGDVDLATVGAIKVHNTIGANPKKFQELQDLVRSAVRVISPVRDFKKVIYGDVYVVGQLRQATTLAWYSVKEDEVYLRNLAKKGIDDLYSLIHEYGHRYWFRFASPLTKSNIAMLYSKLATEARRVRVPDLKVGDILPVPVRGTVPPLVITNITTSKYVVKPKKLPIGVLPKSDMMVSISAVESILKRQAVTGKIFPTMYSMKNVEEFFAECFAGMVLGRLPKNLLTEFEAALK